MRGLLALIAQDILADLIRVPADKRADVINESTEGLTDDQRSEVDNTVFALALERIAEAAPSTASDDEIRFAAIDAVHEALLHPDWTIEDQEQRISGSFAVPADQQQFAALVGALALQVAARAYAQVPDGAQRWRDAALTWGMDVAESKRAARAHNDSAGDRRPEGQ